MSIVSVVWVDENEQVALVTLDNGSELSVPNTSQNRHWRMVEAWVSGGGVIAPFVPIPEIPIDFLDRTDRQMARMMEDTLVKIATINGSRPMQRDDFPAPLWAKINARRARRGQPPV